MPQVIIDGMAVDVKDIGTAQAINNVLKERADRIDALETDIADRDKQIELFKADAKEEPKDDAKLPPEFLKKKKKKEGEEENEDAEGDDEETASKHDAEVAALRSERDALQGKIDAMQVDQAKDGEEDEDDEEAKDDSRVDSDDERVKWFNERKGLVALASTLRLDSVDKLDSLELKRAIVSKHTGKDHSKSSAARLDGALPFIQEKLQARQDNLDAAGAALLPKGRQKRTDAQTSYRDSQNNAWKVQRDGAAKT